MRKRLFLGCCLASLFQLAMAQVTLTGVLTDSLGTVITKESTVAVLTKKDLLKVSQGEVRQGHFSVQYVPRDSMEYMLYVFSLGYNDRYLDVTGKQGDVGKVRLSPLSVALREVVVKPGRLQHDIVNGNDVFKIAGTDLAQSHSVTEMLRRLPGISYNPLSGITVVGAGSPLFTINGNTPRPGEMEAITPDRIEDVVINTMPSAKYSTNVNSIIDLKLKKRLKDCVSINSANQMKIDPDVLKEGSSLYVNMVGDKFSNFIGYSYGYNNTTLYIDIEERTQLPDQTAYSMFSDRTGHGIDWTHNFNIAPRYQINEKSYIDLQYALSYVKSRGHDEEDVLRRTWADGVETENVRSILKEASNNRRYNHDLSARYIYDFSSTDKLTLNAGYSNNQVKEYNDYDELVGEQNTDFKIDREANSETFTATADYTALLWKKLTMEAGGSFSYLTSDNRNFYDESRDKDDYVEAREQTAVGYLNVSQTLGRFFYSLGVRGEYQSRTNDYHALGKTDTDHSFYLVPKLGLNYRPSKALSVNLSYNYSRQNPSPVNLDPTVRYENTYSYRVGNPDLKPAESHAVRLRVTHLPSGLALTANYGYNRNAFRFVFLNDENNPQVIKNMMENHDYSKLDASLSYNHRWGVYTLNASTTYKQEFAKANYLGKEIDYSKPTYFVSLNNFFSLPKGFSISLSFDYFSKTVSFPQTNTSNIMGGLAISYIYKNLGIHLDYYASTSGHSYQEYAYLYRYFKFHKTPGQFGLSVTYKINDVKQWFRKNNVNSEAIFRSISSY